MENRLLNQTFYPDVVSTAAALSELATALVERGHQVTVVTGRRLRLFDFIPDKPFARRDTWRGIQISGSFPPGLANGAKWPGAPWIRPASLFSVRVGDCCSSARHDVVVALTTPPLISFIGAWPRKIVAREILLLGHGHESDEAIAAGWLRADSFGENAGTHVAVSFRRADWIIALDRFMRAARGQRDCAGKQSPCWPPWSQDQDVRFDGGGREQFRQQHGPDRKICGDVFGNHSPVHPLDTL